MKANCTLDSEPSTRISHLVNLLGDKVVLIPVRRNTKKPAVKRWQQLDKSCMTDTKHLRSLECGNIGVLLGRVSGGLCTIDIDQDAAVEPFLKANPKLRRTTRTKRIRGCNFWVRMDGDYPKSQKLPFGEWRAGGNQTVISGSADGIGYVFLNEVSPIVMRFEEIVFPAGKPAPTTSVALSALPASSALHLCKVSTVDEAVALALPAESHRNNTSLFTLARGVKTLEAQGKIAGKAARILVFDQWHRRAAERGILRAGQSRDGYLMEFLNAYRRAKYLLIDEVVERAWEAANNEPYPPEAAVFDADKTKRFVALCYQMHRLAKGGEWFIPTRTAKRLLGISHMTAATWLGGLVAMDVLRITKPHTTKQATRYTYQPENTKSLRPT